MKNILTDCRTLTARNLKLSFRNIDTVIMSIMMPAMMMIVFVFLFGGAMDIEGQFGGIQYVNYIVPAVMVLSMCQAATNTATIVCTDMQNGMIDRIRSMAVCKTSFLFAHVLSSVIRNLLSTIIVILFAFVLGFRPVSQFHDWILISLILLLFMFIMAWVSVLIGLVSSSPEAAGGYMMIFFFLPYLSSGFVPTATMPVGLRHFSQYQPMTAIIETLRHLFLATGTPQYLATIIWSSALLIISYFLALLAFNRRVS